MIALAPQAALTVGVLGALGLGLIRRPPVGLVRLVAITAPVVTIGLLLFGQAAFLPPLINVDINGICWQVVIMMAALPLALLSTGDDVETALFMGVLLGMSALSVSYSLPMIFVSLELMSLPAYLLVARVGGNDRSRRLEAAVKYFFAGALAGAFFLLGLALYYAQTGSLGPTVFPLGLAGEAGIALMAIAALFKIGAVPLHWWLPDVYESSAPGVAGFLSTAMKSTAVLFLMKVIALTPQPLFARVLPGIGAATALVGALMALRQEKLQRLLAYSSLAHAGLLILGVGAWQLNGCSTTGASVLLFYLAVYALLSNAAFIFIQASGVTMRAQLRGYSSRDPLLAGAFTIVLFALAGIPPTGGFVAKLLIFWHAMQASLGIPLVVAAVSAVISLVYYLSMVRDIYLEDASGEAPAKGAVTARWIVCLCACAALALAVAPMWISAAMGRPWK
jgi:NADH-quinone oxidoreductase subunit N